MHYRTVRFYTHGPAWSQTCSQPAWPQTYSRASLISNMLMGQPDHYSSPLRKIPLFLATSGFCPPSRHCAGKSLEPPASCFACVETWTLLGYLGGAVWHQGAPSGSLCHLSLWHPCSAEVSYRSSRAEGLVLLVPCRPGEGHQGCHGGSTALSTLHWHGIAVLLLGPTELSSELAVKKGWVDGETSSSSCSHRTW